MKTANADHPRLHLVQTAALVIFAAALPFSVTLIQGGVLLFIAVSLFLRYKEGTVSLIPAEIKNAPLLIPWLAYLAAGALAAAAGADPARSFRALNSDLLTAAAYLGLCLFIRPKARDGALKIYLIAVAFVAAAGIFRALTGQGTDGRAHAFAHPVRFAEIMVIGLALALARLSEPATLSPRRKYTLYGAIFLMTGAIVLSQTRGAYLGTVLLFGMFLAAHPPSRRALLPLLAVLAALGIALAALSPAVRYKAGSIFKGATSAVSAGVKAPDESIGTRLRLWKTGLAIVKDRPLLGVGPANIKPLFTRYCEKPYPQDTIWGSLHNLYVHQAAERGLAGLAALLSLFGAMFVAALRNFRASPSVLTLWALAVMPSWFLMNFTEITFQHVHTSYAVLLALAVSAAARNP